MYLTLVLYILPQLVHSVFIQTGTSTLHGVADSCTNRQEFECMNNVCDPVVKELDVAGATCNFNHGGQRCLESTVAATGTHAMPDNAKDQGTSKHFYCLLVSSYNVPVVVFETSDCTGRSCFIPGDGSYSLWDLGAQGNCLIIAPQTEIWTGPCLSPGEKGVTPFSGGFVAGVEMPIGGNAGLPASYNNTETCVSAPATVTDPPIIYYPTPPIADISTAVWFPFDNSADNGQLDKRAPGGLSAIAALKCKKSSIHFAFSYPSIDPALSLTR